MAKAERTPPFVMKIENGHLVPGSAWDAERLSSYRSGSTVNVVITQEKAAWRQRKYWAILGMVVKTCPVRQKRAEDLHKAIRLKLGIVDSFTTFGGATKVELRSTTAMDEQEFEAFYHEAMELLREQTGVDVETLGEEPADVGPEEQEPSSGPSTPDDAGSGDAVHEAPQAQGVAAAEETAAADLQEAGDAAEEGTPASTPLEVLKLKAEAIQKFLAIADDATIQDLTIRRDVLEQAKDMWKGTLPDHHDFVKVVFSTSDKVIRGKMSICDARGYLAALVR